MKFVRYGEAGKERPGVLDKDGKIRDLSAHIRDINKEFLTKIESLRDLDVESLPRVEEDVRIGPCFADIGNFLCIGLNYVKHAKESNMPIPSEPVLFMKSTSAISGPYDPIILPNGSNRTDWEAELGVIIGRNAKHVSKEEALAYVAGYCVANDVSERALQNATSQWVKGKTCDSFAPIGPWFVTADEVEDPQDLNIWLRLNGTTMQSSNTGDMIFDVAALISHLSSFMTLKSGDILITGTPSGVGMGMKPPVFLKEGDVVELGIDGLGVQKQYVITE